MVKKISVKMKCIKIPVLVDGECLVISNKLKAEILAKKFASLHNGSHLDEIDNNEL